MKISENGINFIKRNEGFRTKVYNDNGKPAIGYGHDLLPGESFPSGITQDKADDLLADDVSKLYPTLEKMAPKANQNQFDALCDFGFNLGVGDLHTMLSHGFEWASVQIPKWHYKKVNGTMVSDDGLVERRSLEVKLFNS